MKAEISGLGLLESGTINLDNKVLAVVGTNEAGKMTLTKALIYISNNAALPVAERSRARQVEDGDEVVSLQLVLTDSDREAVAALILEQVPQSIGPNRAPLARSRLRMSKGIHDRAQGINRHGATQIRVEWRDS